MTGFWFNDSSPAACSSQKVKLRGSPSFHEATGNRVLCNSFSKPMYIQALPNQMIANSICNKELIESWYKTQPK